jgi:hypothetical protein
LGAEVPIELAVPVVGIVQITLLNVQEPMSHQEGGLRRTLVIPGALTATPLRTGKTDAKGVAMACAYLQ